MVMGDGASMLVVLSQHIERHQSLLTQLDRKGFPFVFFHTVPEIQQWLEVNHEPTGLLIDCTDDRFEAFLIRFTLQYADIPTLLLTDQPVRQLELRLLVFLRRLEIREAPLSHGHILLVDDSQTVRSTYSRILENDGFQVDLAKDAEEGFQKAISHEYDLAIIDYYMPGSSGAELCRQLAMHESTSELVKAILTGQYNPRIVNECLEAGARECLFKNESQSLFLSRIRALHRSVQRRIQVDRERNRLIGLLHSVPEGVYGVSPDGLIQFVNPATTRLLGRRVIELLGKSPHECIHPVDAGGQPTSSDFCFLQQAYLLQDELREWRTQFMHSDGSLFMVECNVTPLGGEGLRNGSVVVFRDVSEQQRLEQTWQWQLTHDHLTGLLNRSAFEENLARELAFLQRQKRVRLPSLLFFIDLDKFKRVNDELGHAAGDQLLVNLATQMKNNARATDQVARLSGDEFAVFLGSVNPEDVPNLAEKYRSILEQSYLDWEGQQYQVTGSLGAVLLDERSGTVSEALAKADSACQQAKIKGRNQWQLHSENSTGQALSGDWQDRLNTALSEHRFELQYMSVRQASAPDQTVGWECLIRLREGDTLLTPSLFMAKAQRYGLASDIDRWMIHALIRNDAIRNIHKEQWISINLSTEALADDTFRTGLAGLWRESGLRCQQLVIELTETELFKKPNWKKHVTQLRKQGFRITLDHFGLNANSLLNLSQLPIDRVKLDSTLTRSLSTDATKRHWIDAIIKIAQSQHIRVSATHIENAENLDLVLATGVDEVQGFHLSRPENSL